MDPLVPYLDRLYVFNQAINQIYHVDSEKNQLNFLRTSRAVLDEIASHHVPVILITQLPASPIAPEFLAEFLAKPLVSHIDTRKVFSESPPTKDDFDHLNSFRSWIFEAPPHLRNDIEFAPYKLDYFQLSARGNRVLAEALAREMQRREDLSKLF